MNCRGILPFLADRFKAPQELLATEGLCYLLGRYSTARDSVVTALTTEAILSEVKTRIFFESQTRGDGDDAIVDLEGKVGEQVILSIEAKFGAILQDSQPNDYAERLVPGGSLLFVCPAWRIFRLSQKLQERSARGLLLADEAEWTRDNLGIKWLPLSRGRRLGLISWDSLLGVIKSSSSEVSPDFDSDMRQLEGIVARFEQDLMPWTTQELTCGAAGVAFAKALLATRVVCQAVADRLDLSVRPAWYTFASTATIASKVEDWYGAKITIVGTSIQTGFMPVDWGEDGVATPVRIWFDARKLTGAAIDSLYPVYLQMLEISWKLLDEMLATPPTPATAEHERWWMVPFPLRPDIAGAEARRDTEKTAAALLAPLIEHQRRPPDNM